MDKEYEASLKSIETENTIDKLFYRPLGFKIAKALRNTGITPNAITIISIFIGSAAGILWYFPYNLPLALLGVLSLIIANILDCVDGQLARLTGIKSQIGRILDGVAGDIWFVFIYIALARICNMQFDTHIFTIIIFISAYSHINQAALTDYYKTLHLFFLSKEKGKEFESSAYVRERIKTMSKGINRLFSRLYYYYTLNQERQTPQLQAMLKRLREKYGSDIPDTVRQQLREKSLKLMPVLNLITFNGRSVILFISVLFNVVWIYFIWEIVVLNLMKMFIRLKHESFCKNFE